MTSHVGSVIALCRSKTSQSSRNQHERRLTPAGQHLACSAGGLAGRKCRMRTPLAAARHTVLPVWGFAEWTLPVKDLML